MWQLVLEYWPVIATLLASVSAWIISPRAKLATLRSKNEAEDVKVAIDINRMIREELDRVNRTIDEHSEQIRRLKVALFDANMTNRRQAADLEARDVRIAELEAETEVLRTDLSTLKTTCTCHEG
jgi:chromosome segregation ATPase